MILLCARDQNYPIKFQIGVAAAKRSYRSGGSDARLIYGPQRGFRLENKIRAY